MLFYVAWQNNESPYIYIMLNDSNNIELMTELDFIFARAQLSKSYNGSEPDFNRKGRINIKKGRHPLLDPKMCMP